MSARRGYWDEDDQEWIWSERTFSPSAEDEYLESLEQEQDYTADLILALSTLTEKQRFVIECRYGLRGDKLTTCQIAAMMGVCHSSVVRLEQRAMRQMRRGAQKTPTIEASKGQKETPPQRGLSSG